MALAYNVSSDIPAYTPRHRCRFLRDALVKSGLYRDAVEESGFVQAGSAPAPLVAQWRLAPSPFWLTPEDLSFFQSLGQHLLSFYRALNVLYLDSVRGMQPAWVAAYLDQGKPESLRASCRPTHKHHSALFAARTFF